MSHLCYERRLKVVCDRGWLSHLYYERHLKVVVDREFLIVKNMSHVNVNRQVELCLEVLGAVGGATDESSRLRDLSCGS